MKINRTSKSFEKFIKKLSTEQKKLRIRILEISNAAQISHIGSCFSCVDIIAAIYKVKKPVDKFVLSSGHAGVALYSVLEKKGMMKSPSIGNLHIHPDRNIKNGIYVSTGSLGQGLPIAVGFALANRNENVYCVVSDGECFEGSIWESINIASSQRLGNLKIVVNANGFGAYGKTDVNKLAPKFIAFGARVTTLDGHDVKKISSALSKKIKNKPVVIIAKTTVEQLPFLQGQDAHYKIMIAEEFKLAREILK